MKTLCFFTVSILLVNFGCSNNSGPGANGNNSIGTTTYDAGPYLAFSDNETFTGHLKGTINYLDTAGKVTETDQIDQHSSETIGALSNHDGVEGRAIYYFPSGFQRLIGYIGYATDTSNVMGSRQVGYYGGYESEEIIPQNLTIGEEWAIGGPTACDITLQDHLNQYTASDGKSYSDVLKFTTNYLDSGSYYYADVYKGHGILFFARGVGLVEADIPNYEHLQYGWNYYSGTIEATYHQVASGTVTKD
jgi:hypothetical protein